MVWDCCSVAAKRTTTHNSDLLVKINIEKPAGNPVGFLIFGPITELTDTALAREPLVTKGFGG